MLFQVKDLPPTWVARVRRLVVNEAVPSDLIELVTVCGAGATSPVISTVLSTVGTQSALDVFDLSDASTVYNVQNCHLALGSSAGNGIGFVALALELFDGGSSVTVAESTEARLDGDEALASGLSTTTIVALAIGLAVLGVCYCVACAAGAFIMTRRQRQQSTERRSDRRARRTSMSESTSRRTSSSNAVRRSSRS